jgi:hypothetical protein
MLATSAEGGFVDPMAIAGALAMAVVILAIIYGQRRTTQDHKPN